jgi:hypothetical protein
MQNKLDAGKIRFDFLWPTYICVRNFDRNSFYQFDSINLENNEVISSLESYLPELELIELTAIEIAQELSLHSNNSERVKHVSGQLVVWRHNSSVPFFSNTSRFIALCWLSIRFSGRLPCGTIVMHDPRAGSANISLPGLPFGRPITVNPAQGRLLVIPGWLGYSLMSLSADDEHILWHMELS